MAKQIKAAGKKAANKAAPKKLAPNKTAASKPVASQGKLHGQTIAFVGKIDSSDRKDFAPLLQAHGAKIVDSKAPHIDYLVWGTAYGGKPPGDLAKIQKRIPTAKVLNHADFLAFLMLDRDELVREIKRGCWNIESRFWHGLVRLCFQSKTMIDLTSSNLQGVDLTDAFLNTCKLDGINLQRARIADAVFSNCKKVNFNDCVAAHAFFVDLQHCSFRNADLTTARLTQTHIPYRMQDSKGVDSHCDFTAAILHRAKLEQGQFNDCNFTQASLCDAQARSTDFKRCNFSKADLRYLNARHSTFTDADFTEANLANADFRNTSLKGANLTNANLRGAIFGDADLTGAKVSGANFQNAILFDAKLGKIDFSKALNFTPPAKRKPGPKLLEFAQAAAGSKTFETKIHIDFDNGDTTELRIVSLNNSATCFYTCRTDHRHAGEEERYYNDLDTLDQGMLDQSVLWMNGKVRFESITAKGCKNLRGPQLQALAAAAWAETFRVPYK